MIYLNGKAVRYRVPRQAVRDGIAYITEDRKVDGFFETIARRPEHLPRLSGVAQGAAASVVAPGR